MVFAYHNHYIISLVKSKQIFNHNLTFVPLVKNFKFLVKKMLTNIVYYVSIESQGDRKNMKRTYEMVDKGYEYKTDGYTIKKSFVRKAINNTGFSTLNNYRCIANWNVYPDNENVIYTFRYLKDAKDFIENR